MKKINYLVLFLAVVFVFGALNGCDNRSQMEKDLDDAQRKAGDLLK